MSSRAIKWAIDQHYEQKFNGEAAERQRRYCQQGLLIIYSILEKRIELTGIAKTYELLATSFGLRTQSHRFVVMGVYSTVRNCDENFLVTENLRELLSVGLVGNPLPICPRL